ncbi:MAG: PHP domain-containing protein, partial [Candidatus Krumholzibacteria bacterium]|nr:PHP domain-containing protein [Candidatus Krumholzibacteria bacterium]
MNAPFVHLNVHSNFSFLRGTATAQSLASAAAAMGMKSIALTDTNGLYAVVPFEKACREAGIRPVYGAEIDGSWPGAPREKADGNGPGGARGTRGGDASSGVGPATIRAVLLARNRAGFGEICRIVTSRMLDEDFSLRKALEGASDNVYIISGDPRIVEALCRRANLRAALPTGEGSEYQRERWCLRELARRLGVKTVACGRVCMAAPGDHLVHRVLTAIRTRTTLGTIPAGEAEPRGAFLRDPAQVARVFAGDPESVAETARVADDCRVDLELGRRRLPRFTPPPGETAASLLEKVAMKGLRERLEVGSSAEPAPAAKELAKSLATLRYELSVINGKGLADYFLICWDIVRFARGRGMRSVGRGSAGNSIVSYALGITHVNPIRHNMFFERFLNPEREQLPDFDIDFATEDREEVLQYIFRRYGSDRVAMIGTYSTLRARSALRETAKAMGIPEGEIAPLIKRIPFYASIDRLGDLRRVSPAAAGIPLESEPFRTLIPLARKIGGFPRHMATHPCGLVISPGPVTDLMPLQRGDKGYEITQWSMYEVEAAGLVKIDIIGQKGLAVIQETASMASESEGRPMHPDRIDYLGDPLARKILREGRTEGCFYIESPIMMQLMKQAGCDDFEVLTALSSIIRPGVSNHGGKRSYLRRQLGLEPVPALHPAVAEVLSDTFGCLIYQEQVIKLAVAVAGMSYAEADGLRRCMS